MMLSKEYIKKYADFFLKAGYATIIIVAAFFLVKMLKFSYIFADDTDTALAFTFLDIFKHPANGIYTAGILDNLFGFYLPYKVNIHPTVFKSEYFSFIEAGMIIGFSLIWSKLLYRKFGYLSLLVFIFSLLLILYFCSEQSFILFVYDGLFRILLSAFLWVCLLLFFCKYFKEDNIRNTIFVCIMLFLNVISGEFNFVITFIAVLFFLFSSLVNKKNIKNNILFLICIILGTITLLHTGTFFRKSMYFQNISEIIPQLGDFITVYFKFVIKKHAVSYLLLGFSIIYLNIKYKDDYVKKLTLFSCFTIIGIFIFFASLITLGKTHFGQNEFWVIHPDLHIMLNIFLYSLIFAFINIMLERSLLKEYILFCLILLGSAYLFNFNKIYYEDFIKRMVIPEKRAAYTVEKIIRVANSNNKTAYLDKEFMQYWAFLPFEDNIITEKKYENSPYINYLDKIDKNFDFKTGFIFTDKKKAMEEFKKNGGSFSKDELEKLDFNILFKLQKKENK